MFNLLFGLNVYVWCVYGCLCLVWCLGVAGVGLCIGLICFVGVFRCVVSGVPSYFGFWLVGTDCGFIVGLDWGWYFSLRVGFGYVVCLVVFAFRF